MMHFVYLVQPLAEQPLTMVETPSCYETLSLAVADLATDSKVEQIGGNDNLGMWRNTHGTYLITKLRLYKE